MQDCKAVSILDQILGAIAYTFYMSDTAISVNKIVKLARALLIIFWVSGSASENRL